MNSREWNTLDESIKNTVMPFLAEQPVRLGALARELGLNVKSATLPPGISGEIRPDNDAQSGFVIRVNRHENRARQRFTLAHEIAHFLLHADEIGDGVEDDLLFRSVLSDRREAQANRLAADLVMPWDTIHRRLNDGFDAHDGDSIDGLADELSVSVTALKIRLGVA